MKSYNREKERTVWNKYKAMGKKKFVTFTTLIFIGTMLITAIVPYVLSNYMLGIPNYSPIRILLMLVTYTAINAFIGLKMSPKIWDRRTREFDGATNPVIKIDDDELESLILEGEKIKAVKRYRIVTGLGFSEALRYVDWFSEHELN